jgi:hypothetical protein
MLKHAIPDVARVVRDRSRRKTVIGGVRVLTKLHTLSTRTTNNSP